MRGHDLRYSAVDRRSILDDTIRCAWDDIAVGRRLVVCMRKGVLMVVMHHGPGHVWMMLYGHTTVRVREQWVTWRCWLLDMVGGTEDAMVRGASPR